MTNIAAFDPGFKGGASRHIEGSAVEVIAMPVIESPKKGVKTQLDLPRIREFLTEHPIDLVIIEKQGAMPGQGVTSMMSLGTGYGMLQGMCAGLQIPYQLVTPQAWKKVILAGTTKDKADAIAYCKRKYPAMSLLKSSRCRTDHDGMADAVCIMDFGKTL